MIPYDFGYWGIRFIFQRSDVFWRAGTMGFMSGIATLFLRLVIIFTGLSPKFDGLKGFPSFWGGWTFVLSFLLVFRTQIAYSRYNEGIGLLQQTFGVWINATSNLLAFSSHYDSRTPEHTKAATKFRHLLVRLMSLLHVTALQEIASIENEHFSVIGIHDLGCDSLKYLNKSQDKLEIVMQWIQHLICENHKKGVIWIPPPILSRVFQELSNGIVFVHDAIKITEFPFPYPYAQITTLMLIAYSCSLPIVFAFSLDEPVTASLLAFAIVFSQWGMNYIAAEIEMPFGDDPNDLEIRSMGDVFNCKLRSLMDPLASKIPDFDFNPSRHDELLDCIMITYMSENFNGTDSHRASERHHKRRYVSRFERQSDESRFEARMSDESNYEPSRWEITQTASPRNEVMELRTLGTAQHTTKNGPESHTDYFEESKILPHRTPKADSLGAPEAGSLGAPIACTPKLSLLDTLKADSTDIPLSRWRSHKAFGAGAPQTKSVSIGSSKLPLDQINKVEEGEDPSPRFPHDGLVEHI